MAKPGGRWGSKTASLQVIVGFGQNQVKTQCSSKCMFLACMGMTKCNEMEWIEQGRSHAGQLGKYVHDAGQLQTRYMGKYVQYPCIPLASYFKQLPRKPQKQMLLEFREWTYQ